MHTHKHTGASKATRINHVILMVIWLQFMLDATHHKCHDGAQNANVMQEALGTYMLMKACDQLTGLSSIIDPAPLTYRDSVIILVWNVVWHAGVRSKCGISN